jgi:hypothetical protein
VHAKANYNLKEVVVVTILVIFFINKSVIDRFSKEPVCRICLEKLSVDIHSINDDGLSKDTMELHKIC